jgi:hypothetical protein
MLGGVLHYSFLSEVIDFSAEEYDFWRNLARGWSPSWVFC